MWRKKWIQKASSVKKLCLSAAWKTCKPLGVLRACRRPPGCELTAIRISTVAKCLPVCDLESRTTPPSFGNAAVDGDPSEANTVEEICYDLPIRGWPFEHCLAMKPDLLAFRVLSSSSRSIIVADCHLCRSRTCHLPGRMHYAEDATGDVYPPR